ncbi:MAG: hypothetical protein FWF56_03450 [Firmicutes bacterium]|nr:hypothetical protein [Bacillota bacterium]
MGDGSKKIKVPKWILIYLILITIVFVVSLITFLIWANVPQNVKGSNTGIAIGMFVGWVVLLFIPLPFHKGLRQKWKNDKDQAKIVRDVLMKEYFDTMHRTPTVNNIHADNVSITQRYFHETEKVTYETCKYCNTQNKSTDEVCSSCGAKIVR